jgi:hypothetical protein
MPTLSSTDLDQRLCGFRVNFRTQGLRAVDIDAMKHIDRIGQTVQEDRGLAWTMRAVGLLVIAGSLFFLTRSVSLNPLHDYFFGMTLLVGAVTLAASWMSTPEWEPDRNAQMELVRSDEEPR